MSSILRRKYRSFDAGPKFALLLGFFLAFMANGYAQSQTNYSLTWKATSVFSDMVEITDYSGVVTVYDTTVSALWEGEAEIVQADDELGGTEFQIVALSFNGSYSLRTTSETHSTTRCSGATGPQITETLDTIDSDNELPTDQRAIFEQRLLLWAKNALDGKRDMIIDPFKAGDRENCYPANFVVEATYSDWFTLRKCGIVVTDWGSTWEQVIPISGLTGADGDLMPIDAERVTYVKTAEASYDSNGKPVVTLWEVTLQVSSDVCELDVISQYQDMGIYKSRCYDHVPDPTNTGICPVNNIAGWGCEITALSMMLNYAGYSADPGKLHDFMIEQSLFVDFFFNPVELVEKYTSGECTFRCNYVNSYFQPDLADDLLEEIVCDNEFPAVVGVDLYDRFDGRPGHYVVVTGRAGDRWMINDTSTAKGGRFLDEYEDFIVMGYLAPRVASAGQYGMAEAEPDRSNLVFLVDDNVELKVLDQQGNSTGYDSEQSIVQLEIPNSEYSYFGLRHALTEEWHPVGKKIVVIRRPAREEFRVELEGINDGSYSVDIHCKDRDGAWNPPDGFTGTAKVGSLEVLRVEFDPTPGVPVVVNQVDPLVGGLPVEGLEGWFYSDWFGYYSTGFAPWLFHAEHGFIYRYPASLNASMFVYDHAMTAWWWTSEGIYPFLFVFDPPADNAGTDVESNWLWYFVDTKAPRSFGAVTGDHAGEFLFFEP